MLIDDLNRLIFKGQGMQEKSIRRGEIYRWRKSYAIFPGCFLILKVTYFLFYFKKRKDLKTKQPYFTIQVMVQDGRRQPPWPWWLLLLQLLLSAEHVCFGAQAKIKKSRDARIKKKEKKTFSLTGPSCDDDCVYIYLCNDDSETRPVTSAYSANIF